jgi:large conductance mechanosensitive channel
VVNASTRGVISPLIGLLFKTSFNELKWVLKEDSINENGEVIGEVAVLYGNFLTNIIDFIIVTLVLFVIIKGVNKLKKKEEPEAEVPAGPSEMELLMEIRDVLKNK